MKIIIIAALLLVSACKKNESEGAQKERPDTSIFYLKDKSDLDMKKFRVERKKLRLYDGAPPTIPHKLGSQIANASCNNCHAVGEIHAPNVLHEKQMNCKQCHVPALTKEVFKENNYRAYWMGEKRQERANPLAAPYIPHRLQDRKDCTICHTAAGSRPELEPKHGQISNCTQCHVQLQEKMNEFSR